MKKSFTLRHFVVLILLLTSAWPAAAQAALLDRVNEAFGAIYSRLPTSTEWHYWANRVVLGEKKTYDALVGAIAYQNAHPSTASVVLGITTPPPTVPAASKFITNPLLYPSTKNPNFLPEGTLVKSPSKPDVFYLKNGQKSWVLPSVLNLWLHEAHFFKGDLIVTISDADLARYPRTTSVNPLYAGKVLKHPTGAQFYIDDKLRKRPLSAAARKALKFPAKNLYPTTAAHLQEFKTGPALAGNKQPGGMIIYDGPFHGGRIWRLEEGVGGVITKRLYLGDYFYEAEYYPDESQRVAVSATELAQYQRGPNIGIYPSGWVVLHNNQRYVFQNGSLRLIGSPALFSAMGYNPKYVLTAFSQFYRGAPHSQPIGAFKTIVAPNINAVASPQAAATSATHLIKVRPHVRSMIARMNDIALPIYDRELTAAENKFWVDYVYNGEVSTETALKTTMARAALTKTLPSRTSRTAILSDGVLEQHWFPYLFYFVHQLEPDDDDRDYWFGRIRAGDRDTIEKLGGTLQYLKEMGLRHK